MGRGGSGPHRAGGGGLLLRLEGEDVNYSGDGVSVNLALRETVLALLKE